VNAAKLLACVSLVTAVCGPFTVRAVGQEAPTVIADLQAQDVKVRRSAAARMRSSDKDVQRQALPVLGDLLMKEKDGQVRLAVFDAITALGPDAAPAVPALVHTLRSDYGGQDLEERHQDYRAALALAAIGKPAVEELRALLKERKESVRAEVVSALGRIGPDAAPAVPELIALLGDKNERVQHEVPIALGRIGPAAVEPLIAAVASQEINIRARAAASLGYLPAVSDIARRALIECARDPAPAVRASAVDALSRIQAPDDALLPLVRENVGHKDEQVRLAVVNLLVDRPALARTLTTELEALLTAEDDGAARHAAFLLSRMGADAVPRLIKALGDPKSRIDQLALALAQIGRPAVSSLTTALGDPGPRVRRGAALALGQIRPVPPGTVTALAAGLADGDGTVKTAFLTAIGYLGPRASEAVPAVRQLLKDDSPEIRARAIDILSGSAPHDDRLLSDLTALVGDTDFRVQRRAVANIRTLGPLGRKSLPVVIDKLASPDIDVYVAAADMIGSHGEAAGEAVPALGSLLDAPVARRRIVAVQTLGRLGKAAQPVFARLTPLVEAEQPEVREAAISTLGSLELDAETVRPYLSKALGDDKPEVRRAAMGAIQRLGPQGAILLPDLILVAVKKESQRPVERLLRRFERSGPDARSIPELVKQLEHEQESVRLLAIKFLGLAGEKAADAVPALERMRDDPVAEVRKQAEAALERIKTGGASDSKKTPDGD
jgi:HEAT repeat protein